MENHVSRQSRDKTFLQTPSLVTIIVQVSELYFVNRRKNSHKHRVTLDLQATVVTNTYFVTFVYGPVSTIVSGVEQEGQHPLTGQRATNFRLLANQ